MSPARWYPYMDLVSDRVSTGLAAASTSHGTGFARILAEFSSRYGLETSCIDILGSADAVVDDAEGSGLDEQERCCSPEPEQ